MLISSNPENGSFKSRLPKVMLLKPRIMELCLGTCPHDRSETRKASAKSPLFQRHFFLSVQRRFVEFLARPLPQSFTLVLEPWNFSLLYLLLIVSIIMFQGSIFYITQGCYSSCSEDEPQIWRFPVIRKSREASVRFLRPNPSPLARPWPSTLAISRMRTCLLSLVASSGYCRWWRLRIFS